METKEKKKEEKVVIKGLSSEKNYIPDLDQGVALTSTEQNVIDAAIPAAIQKKIEWLKKHPEYLMETEIHIFKEESEACIKVVIPSAELCDFETGNDVKVEVRKKGDKIRIADIAEGDDKKELKLKEGDKSTDVMIDKSVTVEGKEIRKGGEVESIQIGNKVTKELK